MHYCLFVKVLFFLLEVFPEELSFLSLRQLIEFIISSSVCQELFSFCFQVSFKTRLLITRSNSSLVYQNFQLVSSIFYFLNFFSEIRVAFVRRNRHKVYQDCLSMSSSFCIFLIFYRKRTIPPVFMISTSFSKLIVSGGTRTPSYFCRLISDL